MVVKKGLKNNQEKSIISNTIEKESSVNSQFPVRQCCLDKDHTCNCESNSKCILFFQKFAKVVWCADTKCTYNVEAPFEHVTDRGLGYKPFKDDVCTHVCSRSDISLAARDITDTLQTRRDHLATCSVRSDKKFSRLRMPHADSIQGGNLPDSYVGPKEKIHYH